MISSLINGISQISSYVSDVVSQIGSIFSGINLADLFSPYFPHDISVALAGFLTLLLFIALIGLLKKIVFFLGG